jgi:chemotaxis protein CheC
VTIITGGYMIETYTAVTNAIQLPERDMAVWKWLASRGTANSMAGLSRMIGYELNVNELDVNYIMGGNVVDILGGTDKTVVGIYSTITGDGAGHLLFVNDSQMALDNINHRMQISQSSTTGLGELELSILGEIGNIAGALFLNVLSDVTNLHLSPSPPRVMIGSAGEIINTVYPLLFKEQEAVLAIRIRFGNTRQQSRGTFLVIPTLKLMRTMIENARIMQW